MNKLSLNIQSRSDIGKTATADLRRSGRIPAVAYRAGKEAIAFSVEEREFLQKGTQALSSQVFQLDGDSHAKGIALVKDIQRDGLKGRILHIDFLILEPGQPAVVRVPISVVGEAPGVKNSGGVLNVQAREITLKSPPEAIPTEIFVDVSKLQLGDRIYAGDIKLPEKVALKSNPRQAIANVLVSRASKLAEADAASAAKAA